MSLEGLRHLPKACGDQTSILTLETFHEMMGKENDCSFEYLKFANSV